MDSTTETIAQLQQENAYLRQRIADLEQAAHARPDAANLPDIPGHDGQIPEPMPPLRYALLADLVPIGAYRSTLDGHLLSVTPVLVELLGYPDAAELLRTPAQALYVHAQDRQYWHETVQQRDRVAHMEVQFRRFDGTTIWVREHAYCIYDDHLATLVCYGFVEEITSRKQAELLLRQSETRLRSIVDNIDLVFWVTSPDHTTLLYVNRAYETIWGRSCASLYADPFSYVQSVHPADVPLLDMLKHNAIDQDNQLEFRIVPFPGGERWVWAHNKAVRDDHGTLLFRLTVVKDITDRKAYEAQIEHLAHTDPLTELANRRRLYQVGESILRTLAPDQSLALLYLDLDRFKAVNDTLGHDAGDQLLIEVARRFGEALNDNALLARIGGDEFAVLLPDASEQQAIDTAEAMLMHLGRPFTLFHQLMYVNGSIGISVGTMEYSSFSTLLTQADRAMYQAKGTGSGIMVYDARHDMSLPDQIVLETDLRLALVTEELLLHYQPIHDLRTGTITGMEALVRWYHPHRGMLLPDFFLPIAIDADLIRSVDSWVLSAAIRQAAAWYHEGKTLCMAINLTPQSLNDVALIEEIHDLLAAHELPADRIIIELTEHIQLQKEPTLYVLDALRSLGIQIALDDFGSSYASIRYLYELPLDMLKLDRVFTAGIGRELRSESITRSLVALASELHLQVIVEGIEEQAQIQWLQHNDDVIWVQGFLLGRPAPLEHRNGTM